METSTLGIKIRYLFFELKRNPKAREASRIFLLSIALSISILYVLNILLISPERKKISTLMAKKSRLEQELRDQEVIESTVVQLERQYSILENKLKRLGLKRRILLLERSHATDEATFRRIVLGMGPGMPKLRSFGLVKIVREIHAPIPMVTLQGEMTYGDLLEYLGYLQKRREIGYLDRLNIAEGFCEDGRRQRKKHRVADTICFQIVAGREFLDTEDRE